jgi:hypothetical protein
MFMTLFLDYPNQLICFNKHSIEEFINGLVEQTALTKPEVLEHLGESLGATLVLFKEENSWDELFDMLERKSFFEGEDIKATEMGALDTEEREKLKIGAHNFCTSMKEHYPEMFAEVSKQVEQAYQMHDLVSQAEDDPELAELLNSVPKGQA